MTLAQAWRAARGRLGDDGTVREARGLILKYRQSRSDRELDVHQSENAEFPGHRFGGVGNVCRTKSKAKGGMTHALSPLWIPRFDMFHDRADNNRFAIRDAVHIDFHGIFQEASTRTGRSGLASTALRM